MKLFVLGPLEVRRDGEVVPVRRGRPRRLLLSLVVRRGGAVPQETLIDQLWGDEPPVNAENALQILISYLRKSVRGTGVRIDRAPAGYRLLLDAEAVDMWEFERLVEQARQPDVPLDERVRLTSNALALWRGPALSEAADDPFAQGDIARLDELRLLAFEARTAALLDLGRHEEALPDLAQLVREHPFREGLHGQLALALYRAGRQADSLRALEQAREALIDELGLDPSPELQRLSQRILRQDPDLDPPQPVDAPPVPSPSSPTPSAATPLAPTDGPMIEAPEAPAGVEPPSSMTSLVGRDEQIGAVLRVIRLHRVVTLTGPGGAGKSRLAAECAAKDPRRAWWADLSAADSPASLHAAVAAAVGTGRSGDDSTADIARRIGPQDALLVLDTCEHLVEAARALTRYLIASCPGLTVIATSRQPLDVPGELAWPVPPLSLPDPQDRRLETVRASPAVQLFVDRAGLARPDFALTTENAPDVAAACLMLDGLPLAIELAAGHASALSPAKITALLGDRMRLIADTGRRDRHAGLRAAIGWSYELLADHERQFLDRLSVFAGPFPIEAAAEVAGAGLPADGLSLLLGLVRQSLVSVAGEDRFRLLETVRAHAAGRLAADPEQERSARDRHARYFSHFAEDADRNIRGADQAGWLADLRAAGADLSAALQHCFRTPQDNALVGARAVCSLSWFWSHEGAFEDASHWIEQARSLGPHDALTEARLHLAAGMHAESLGDLRLAEQECRAAAELFARLGDARGQARSLLHIGTAMWASGRLPEAAAAQERAIALFRDARHDSGTGLSLVLRARTAVDQDDNTAAQEFLADAAYVLERAGDQHLIALRLDQTARACLHEGRPEQAQPIAERSLEIFERVGYQEGVVAALQTIGSARLDSGDATAAAKLFVEATRRALDLSHAPAVAEGMDRLAEAAVADAPELAARLSGHADAIRGRLGLGVAAAQARRRDRWVPVLRLRLEDQWSAARAEGAASSAEELLDAASRIPAR